MPKKTLHTKQRTNNTTATHASATSPNVNLPPPTPDYLHELRTLTDVPGRRHGAISQLTNRQIYDLCNLRTQGYSYVKLARIIQDDWGALTETHKNTVINGVKTVTLRILGLSDAMKDKAQNSPKALEKYNKVVEEEKNTRQKIQNTYKPLERLEDLATKQREYYEELREKDAPARDINATVETLCRINHEWLKSAQITGAIASQPQTSLHLHEVHQQIEANIENPNNVERAIARFAAELDKRTSSSSPQKQLPEADNAHT